MDVAKIKEMADKYKVHIAAGVGVVALALMLKKKKGGSTRSGGSYRRRAYSGVRRRYTAARTYAKKRVSRYRRKK